MNAKKITVWLAALALAGSVLPCQERVPGSNLRVPEGLKAAAAGSTGEGWAVEWLTDFPNPVPVRLETSYYGEDQNPGTGLMVDCYIGGENHSVIRVAGGEPGAQVRLFCAPRPDAIDVPFGTVLVSPDCVQVAGTFNHKGVFDIPVDLAQEELAGYSAYFQALQIAPPRVREPRYSPFGHFRDNPPIDRDIGPRLSLSWGFKMRFAPGNPQPELHHVKPALNAILCKADSNFMPTLYSLLVRFDAAASYELFVDEVAVMPDKTEIMVRLKSPGGPKGARVSHREVVDLGLFPSPVLEVWVSMDHFKAVDERRRRRGLGEHFGLVPRIDSGPPKGCRTYALGAVVRTVF